MVEYRWTALAVTTVGTLMASLDTNIVVIALPTIARSLPGLSILGLLWVLIGYSLVTSAILLTVGRLADQFGRVRLFTLGFAVFTFGSVLCGFASTGDQLVGFRMVQAVGAALLFANGTAIVTDAFPPHQRAMALGINQVAIVVGSVAGLVLGGLLTATVGWRWIFFVNVPIGIVAVAVGWWKLRDLASPDRDQPIDWLGNVLFAGGLSLLLVAATTGPLDVVSGPAAIGLAVLGLLLLAGFVAVERIVPAPMFDLRLFRIAAFTAGNVSIFLNALARGAFAFVIVFYLQGPPRFLSPLTAGLFLIPVSAALAALAPLSGWLSDRYGVRPFAVSGLAISAVGFALLAMLDSSTTFVEMLPGFVLVGAGMGLYAAPNRASIMNSVPPNRRGVAAGISATLIMAASTASLAFAIGILSTTMSLDNLTAVFLGASSGSAAPLVAVAPFLRAVRLVFAVSAGVVALAIIPSAIRGDRSRPPTRTHHRRPPFSAVG
jgi:EmrB/QacA subfamily drug resistance transporter